MLGRIVRHELSCMAADRTLWIAMAVFAGLVGYATFNGDRWVNSQRETLEAAVAEESQRLGVMQMTLIRIEGGRALPGPADRDPTRAGAVGRSLGERNAILPPAPLAALSMGQGDLLPPVVPVSTESGYAAPGREEIVNPLHLLTGRFDLAFVILFLLPLLILALTFDILSRERRDGTLAMVLSQPVGLRTVLAGKVAARAAVVLGVTLGVAIGGLALTGALSSAAALPLALWIVAASLYAAFWFALAVLANLFGQSSGQQAVALAGAWLLLTVVIPSAATLTARTLHPVPSRAEMIVAEREAAQVAQGEGSGLLARYLEDHPELVPGGEEEIDEFFALSHAVQRDVERQMESVRRRYDTRIHGQQRLLDRLRFLSPALVAQAAFDDLAGTGPARYRHFTEQVEEFRAEFNAYFDPLVTEGARFTSADVGRIPAWTFREEPRSALAGRVTAGLVGLLLVLVLIGTLARARLSRYTPSP